MKQQKEYISHPLHRTTELPKRFGIRRNLELKLFHNDYITIGHVFSNLFPDAEFLLLNTTYAIIAEAILEEKQSITCCALTEDYIEFMDEEVSNTFRAVSTMISPTLVMGPFDVVIYEDFYREEYDTTIFINDVETSKMEAFIKFIDRQSKEYLIILSRTIDDNYYLQDNILNTTEDYFFDQNLNEQMYHLLNNKLVNFDVQNFVIMRKEVEEECLG